MLRVLGLCSGTKSEQRQKYPRVANRSEDVSVRCRTSTTQLLKRLNMSPVCISICGWVQFSWEAFHPTQKTATVQQALRSKSRVGRSCVHSSSGCHKMEEEGEQHLLLLWKRKQVGIGAEEHVAEKEVVERCSTRPLLRRRRIRRRRRRR